MEVELRSVIHYCYLRKLDPKDAEVEINSTYGGKMCHIKTIRNWYKRFDEGRTDLSDLPRSGRPVDNTCLGPIKELLENQPFISAKAMSYILGIPKSTLLLKLHNELNLVKVNLRWVPHTLSPIQKQQRIDISKELLTYLEKGPSVWNWVITGDQSWIFWDNPHTSQWIVKGTERPIHAKHNIASKKTMITVFLSCKQVILVKILKNGEHFNSSYMIQEIFPALYNEMLKTRPKIGLQGTKIHIDNAKSHNSKMTMNEIDKYRMKRMPHPAYSPDIAICDFWFFGMLKDHLKGMQFNDENELFNEISTFCKEIPQNEFQKAFEEWIHRLNWIIKNGGEYYHE